MQHASKIVQIGEAAEMLNLTPSGVRWLIDVGKLPAERTGLRLCPHEPKCDARDACIDRQFAAAQRDEATG